METNKTNYTSPNLTFFEVTSPTAVMNSSYDDGGMEEGGEI